jgi:hypothetical protein
MKNKISKSVVVLFLSLIAFSVNAQNTVVMKDGSKVSGKVDGIANGVISITTGGVSKQINVSSVSSISFDDAGSGAVNTNGQKAVSLSAKEKTIMAGPTLVRYLVNERNIIKAPTITNLTRERGTVVINVSIDRYGNVISADPTPTGSTTTSEYLITKATQAAQSAKFNADPTAPISEKGYIIIPL